MLERLVYISIVQKNKVYFVIRKKNDYGKNDYKNKRTIRWY